MILTIRTDNPEAEIGLYKDTKQVAYETWQAHRELSRTIHTKIQTLLDSQHVSWNDISGIVCFKGPGSFTGLRIGLTVGNTLAYSLKLPIVAEEGERWTTKGLKRLSNGETDKVAMPEYGAEANITTPRK